MTISEINSNYNSILTTPFLGRKIELTPNSVEKETAQSPDVEIIFSRKDFFNIGKTALRAGNFIGSDGTKKSNKEIVENSINGGLSPLEAVNVYKAQRAYGLSNINQDPTSQLYTAETDV